jgi:predicted nucleic acid-binding protein
MTGTLVDTNVLLDVITDDPKWADWSIRTLAAASLSGPLIVNDVIYTELSVQFPTVEELDRVVLEAGLTHARTPPAALFLAGKAFKRYREADGPRTGVLSDFFIGAHAAVAGVALLTRDSRRYKVYFPTVRLIAP